MGLSLLSQLTAEMRDAWHAGRPLTAEALLDRHPDLNDQPEAAIRLIFEEFCLRQEYGESVELADFLCRFPRWRAQLEVVLNRQQFFPPSTPLPAGRSGVVDDW